MVSVGLVYSRVPRQDFTLWLAIRDRLSIGVRTRSWELLKDVFFVEKETKVGTTYFLSVLSPILSTLTTNILGASADTDWSITIASLLRLNRPKLDAILLRMFFSLVSVSDLEERNSCRHQKPCLTTKTLIGHPYVTGFHL